MNINEKEIEYIAKRYRHGKFSADRAWRALNIRKPSPWRRYRVAAAVGSLIFLSAAAAVIYHQATLPTTPTVEITAAVEPIAPLEAVKVIDFENAPLPDVIARIKEVYGVEVENLPANADQYRLSLHYEGNARELVATINEILETQITVKE